jgi:hypothetical protein
METVVLDTLPRSSRAAAKYPATIKQGGCKPPFDGWLALEFAPHRLRVAYGDIVMLTGNLTLTG